MSNFVSIEETFYLEHAIIIQPNNNGDNSLTLLSIKINFTFPCV